jgi:uncharacterized protein (DUF4415 family)
MNAKSKNIKSNLKKIDAHVIQPEEYEELPEVTDEMFKRAAYKVGGVKKLAPKRRNSQKTSTETVQLHLPREVVDYFKQEGNRWQSKIGSALQSWIKSHPHH